MFEDIITGIDDIINDINEIEPEESWDAGNGPWTTGQKQDIWSTGQGSGGCGGKCGNPDADGECDACPDIECDGCLNPDCEQCDVNDVNIAPDEVNTDPFPLEPFPVDQQVYIDDSE